MTAVPVPVTDPEPVVVPERVTARFWVQSTLREASSPDGRRVTLRPTTRGKENQSWAKWTPDGELTMLVNNPAAAQFFEDHIGQDLELTFRPLGTGLITSPHGDG